MLALRPGLGENPLLVVHRSHASKNGPFSQQTRKG